MKIRVVDDGPKNGAHITCADGLDGSRIVVLDYTRQHGALYSTQATHKFVAKIPKDFGVDTYGTHVANKSGLKSSYIVIYPRTRNILPFKRRWL